MLPGRSLSSPHLFASRSGLPSLLHFGPSSRPNTTTFHPIVTRRLLSSLRFLLNKGGEVLATTLRPTSNPTYRFSLLLVGPLPFINETSCTNSDLRPQLPIFLLLSSMDIKKSKGTCCV